jgi:hypothetical protein
MPGSSLPRLELSGTLLGYASAMATQIDKTKKREPKAQKKPSVRWRKQVLTIMEKWAKGRDEVTFIFESSGCRIQQRGLLIRAENMFCFLSRFEMRVYLFPELWVSAEIDHSTGISIQIDQLGSDSSFMLTDRWPTRPVKPEKIPQICEQFELWAKLGCGLSVIFHHGLYATVGHYHLEKLSSQYGYALVAEGGTNAHILSLDNCRAFKWDRQKDSCTISVFGEQWQPSVDISDRKLTPSEMFEQFSPIAKSVH